MTMQQSNKERINVIFPEDVLKELRRLVSSKQRSRVIVEATAERSEIVALVSAQQLCRDGVWGRMV